MSTAQTPRRMGLAQACAECYQRKIRCDLGLGKTSCTNCSLYNTECRPRLRKRKRASGYQDAEPPRPTRQPTQSHLPHPNDSLQPSLAVSPRQSEITAVNLGHHDNLITSTAPPDATASASHPTPAAATRASVASSCGTASEEEEVPETTPTGRIHDGRAVYHDAIAGRNAESEKAYQEQQYQQQQHGTMTSIDMAILQSTRAFELPSRAIKSCYIDNFFKYVYPWVPVVEPAWLQESTAGKQQKPSILLLQAVLFVGSRLTMPNSLEASSELYARAKSLFFSKYERNPMILIITCILLQWWNPSGPEHICMDNSHFWMRTGVGIAMEIGLHKEHSTGRDVAFRRRLWWSLVSRDCQISTAHGRPRTIQHEESSVSFLTVRDFPKSCRTQPALTIHYAAICRIFGAVGERCRRKQMTPARAIQLQNELYVWVRELPSELRLFRYHHLPAPSEDGSDWSLNTYSFEARQLHVIYFVTMTLLLRQSPSPSQVATGSLLAVSFVAAIFDEFLIRGEINHLGPAIHKFFLLIAGITLLSARNIPELRDDVMADFDVVKKALRQFAERYPGSLTTIQTFERLETAQQDQSSGYGAGQCLTPRLIPLKPEIRALFREFGPGFCRQWHLIGDSASDYGVAKRRKSGQQQQQLTTGRQRQRTESTSHPPPSSGSMVPSNMQGSTAVATTHSSGFPLGTGPGQSTMELDSVSGMTEGLDMFWPWADMPDPTTWILQDTPFDLGDDAGIV